MGDSVRLTGGEALRVSAKGTNRARTLGAKFLFLLICTLAPGLQSAWGQSSSSVLPDILSGQRYMKRTDDVSFMPLYSTDNNQSWNIDVVTYDTSNSQFAGSTPTSQQEIGYSFQWDHPLVNQLPAPPPIAIASGRMFNTGNDQFVAMGPITAIYNNPETDWQFIYYSPPDPNANPPQPANTQTLNTKTPYAIPFDNGGGVFTWLVMGNFRGDGLKEALAVFANTNGNTVSWAMEVLGAQTNGNNAPVTNSLMTGPVSIFSAQFSQRLNFVDFSQTSVSVGDFNGDGRDEIAMLMGDQQTIRFYTVDPSSYAINPMAPATFTLSSPVYRANLVPGRFMLPNQVDLVAMGTSADPNGDLRFEYINTQSKGSGTFSPRQENPANIPQQPTNTEPPYAFFAYAVPLIQPRLAPKSVWAGTDDHCLAKCERGSELLGRRLLCESLRVHPARL